MSAEEAHPCRWHNVVFCHITLSHWIRHKLFLTAHESDVEVSAVGLCINDSQGNDLGISTNFICGLKYGYHLPLLEKFYEKQTISYAGTIKLQIKEKPRVIELCLRPDLPSFSG